MSIPIVSTNNNEANPKRAPERSNVHKQSIIVILLIS